MKNENNLEKEISMFRLPTDDEIMFFTILTMITMVYSYKCIQRIVELIFGQ